MMIQQRPFSRYMNETEMRELTKKNGPMQPFKWDS